MRRRNLYAMAKIKKLTYLLVLIVLFSIPKLHGQGTKPKPIGIIAFYNLENLFDTEDDPDIKDEEYLSGGRNHWTPERYANKLSNMARVIASIGQGPDIIGVCEVENRKVLEDLVQTSQLATKSYQIIHFDSPDRRGIDVALLYKPGIFLPFHTALIPFKDENDPGFRTRDMLWVKGLFNKDTLNIVVNHWPSRRGGKESKRIIAAQILRSAVDSVQRLNPDAKIILMGDFNDDPSNKSLKKHLRSKGKTNDLSTGDLFNASTSTFKKGNGTLSYRGAWNLFDQIIVTQSLLPENSTTYSYIDNSFQVFGPDWMRVQDGQFAGSPLRTFSFGAYKNGYSDHFPAFIVLGEY